METTGTLSNIEFGVPWYYLHICRLIPATAAWNIHYILQQAISFPMSPPHILGRCMALIMMIRTMSCQETMLPLMTVSSHQVPFANWWDLSSRCAQSIAIMISTKPSFRYGNYLRLPHSLSEYVVRLMSHSLSLSCLYKQDGHHWSGVWVAHSISKR